MEELFETVAWELPAPESNSKLSREPLWARVCALSGGVLLVAVGTALVALGSWMEFTW